MMDYDCGDVLKSNKQDRWDRNEHQTNNLPILTITSLVMLCENFQ